MRLHFPDNCLDFEDQEWTHGLKTRSDIFILSF